MAKVLAISSQVVLGSVGLSIAVPALYAEGHEVLAVPTVLLSNHPGLGRPKGGAIDIVPLLDGVDEIQGLSGVDAVFTGYFSQPLQVEKAADVIRKLRPAMVTVDPILGDNGKLYVADAVAHAIKSQLVPLATVLTPNLFELSWLTGHTITDENGAMAAARALARPEVIVTSVPAADQLLTLRVTSDVVQKVASQKRAQVPHGTGDYLAGLYLAHRLKQDAGKAFTATMARLDAVIAASIGRQALEWQLARN
jgi:pyridoxine kinase